MLKSKPTLNVGMKSTFRPRQHTHTIPQANLRADNVMEIRVRRCSKMTHKSCAREKIQNAAVCMMDTNGRLMSGKLPNKYLSLCCMGYFPGNCRTIHIF